MKRCLFCDKLIIKSTYHIPNICSKECDNKYKKFYIFSIKNIKEGIPLNKLRQTVGKITPSLPERNRIANEIFNKNKLKLKEIFKEHERELQLKRINKHKLQKKKWVESNAIYNTYAPQIDWCEKIRRDPDNYNWLQVKCSYCGKWYNPRSVEVKSRIQALNGAIAGEARLYCSPGCKKLCPIYGHVTKSAEETGTKQLSREVQPELRQMVFERDDWTCQKCGGVKRLQCHHKEGIRWAPLESADIAMCITYCVSCHKKAHKKEGCSYYEMRCTTN